jgi:hypothetical protein
MTIAGREKTSSFKLFDKLKSNQRFAEDNDGRTKVFRRDELDNTSDNIQNILTTA